MTVPVFCVRCKKKTKNDGAGEIKLTSKGNRRRLQVKCKECGINKSQFIGKSDN